MSLATSFVVMLNFTYPLMHKIVSEMLVAALNGRVSDGCLQEFTQE